MIIHRPTLTNPGNGYNINSILKVQGTSPVQFLLDSEAAVSVVRYGALEDQYHQQMTTPNTPIAIAANGTPLELVCQVTIPPISIAEFSTTRLFTVALNVTVDSILSIDFLLQHDAVIDCKQKCVTMETFWGQVSVMLIRSSS